MAEEEQTREIFSKYDLFFTHLRKHFIYIVLNFLALIILSLSLSLFWRQPVAAVAAAVLAELAVPSTPAVAAGVSITTVRGRSWNIRSWSRGRGRGRNTAARAPPKPGGALALAAATAIAEYAFIAACLIIFRNCT